MMQHNIDQARSSKTWIYVLAPYMESVDAIRLCPEDSKTNRAGVRSADELRDEWLSAPDDGFNLRQDPGFCPEVLDAHRTHRTIIMFEAGMSVDSRRTTWNVRIGLAPTT